MPVDRLRRPVRDLRVSVTDRCNFRCTYCMPREVFGPGYAFLEREELLTFEEITRVVTAFARAGVRKVRLTGGEPLVRRELERLIAAVVAVEGITDVSMTTNGSLLTRAAQSLYDAGLRRVTVSLDSVDEQVFSSMADVTIPLATVLEGVQTARAVGLDVKLNAVVKRGVNDDGLVELARYGRAQGCIVRYIEFMDVGTTNGWRLDDVVPGEEIVARVGATYPLEPVTPNYPGEVATRFRYQDGGGEIGVITSVSQPFCATCTRARLTAVGELYTCLFGATGTDLRAHLREGADDDELDAVIAAAWTAREDRYSALRNAETAGLPKVEMSYIGG